MKNEKATDDYLLISEISKLLDKLSFQKSKDQNLFQPVFQSKIKVEKDNVSFSNEKFDLIRNPNVNVRKSFFEINDYKSLEDELEILSDEMGAETKAKELLTQFCLHEKYVLSLLKQKERGSYAFLIELFNAFEKYNALINSLKMFKDDVFVAKVLKLTNSSYKKVFAETILRMCDRIKEKKSNKGKEFPKISDFVNSAWGAEDFGSGVICQSEEDDEFSKLVALEKEFFIFQNNDKSILLNENILNEKYERKYQKNHQFYRVAYSGVMYQSFFDLIYSNVCFFKQRNDLSWKSFLSCSLNFSSFFKMLFNEILGRRILFLTDPKYTNIFKDEKELLNKLKQSWQILSLQILADEKKLNEWNDFVMAVNAGDLAKTKLSWQIFQHKIGKKIDLDFAVFFENFAKNVLFVPYLCLKNVPYEVDLFLKTMDQILFIEKKELKRLLRFTLKISGLYLMPFFSMPVLKCALKEMKQAIEMSLNDVKNNLFLLYRLGLEKETIKLRLNQQIDFETIDVCNRDITGQTVMHYAAATGDKFLIKKLQKRGADINVIDFQGQTPLHVAVKSKNFETASCLIKLGGDLNVFDFKKQTPLMLSIINQDEQTSLLLLKSKASLLLKDFSLRTAVHYAAVFNLSKLLSQMNLTEEVLLSQDDEGKTPLQLAVSVNATKSVKTLLEKDVCVKQINECGTFLLIESLKNNNASIFELLLNKGANPYGAAKCVFKNIQQLIQKSTSTIQKVFETYEKNKKIYECLLFKGVLNSNVEMIEAAVEKGAHLSNAVFYQKTALELALEIGEKKIISLLVKNNCYKPLVMPKNIGHFALIKAMLSNDVSFFLLLLRAGVGVNSMDEGTKHTILHHAVVRGKVRFAEILIENGADIDAKDIYGRTPVYYAKQLYNKEMEFILTNTENQ